jgi:sugar lactone lactonase YvrE
MTNFNNDSLLTMKTTSAFSTPFLGNVDCNRGTITLDGITWDAQTGSNKIIVRTTAELVAKECRFKGNAGAVEALSATNEVDIYNSVITTASGNTLVTDTATTRLWNCAFDPGGTYAVATSGGAVAITMDQCIGSKVLDPNVTDTIGNYTANAAWAGLK